MLLTTFGRLGTVQGPHAGYVGPHVGMPRLRGQEHKLDWQNLLLLQTLGNSDVVLVVVDGRDGVMPVFFIDGVMRDSFQFFRGQEPIPARALETVGV